jgi:hypothetical protein
MIWHFEGLTATPTFLFKGRGWDIVDKSLIRDWGNPLESLVEESCSMKCDLDQGSQTRGPHWAHHMYLCSPGASQKYKFQSNLAYFESFSC